MSPKDLRTRWWHSNRLRVAVAVIGGLAAGGGAFASGAKDVALLVCGDVGALIYVVWVFLATRRLDGEQTRILSTREDPGRAAIDSVVLLACLGAIGAVGQVLLKTKDVQGSQQDVLAGVGAFSVFCAWLLVHTLFMLRYARLYHEGEPGGIDFNCEETPAYREFAYLAFTVGMTFQVSDTDIIKGSVRRAVLHHALLSYLFGTVIVATTINLVAGLGK